MGTGAARRWKDGSEQTRPAEQCCFFVFRTHNQFIGQCKACKAPRPAVTSLMDFPPPRSLHSMKGRRPGGDGAHERHRAWTSARRSSAREICSVSERRLHTEHFLSSFRVSPKHWGDDTLRSPSLLSAAHIWHTWESAEARTAYAAHIWLPVLLCGV